MTTAQTAPSGQTLLSAESLEFGYGSDNTIQIKALEVHAGELVGLLGRNGAGKSTCLRLLAGLLPPRHGLVHICGRCVERISPRDRARLVAWVPQRTDTPFEWTVGEMVAMGRYPYLGGRLRDRKEDAAAVRGALERVGLLELRDRPVGTLSGGEWQRSLLARALAQEARVLLLDEPVASLDLGYQRRIYEMVQELCRRDGVAAIAADHHVDLQAMFCDRLILIDEGRILAQGRPEEVLRPETLEAAYRTPLRVVPDEETGRPTVRWRLQGEADR